MLMMQKHVKLLPSIQVLCTVEGRGKDKSSKLLTPNPEPVRPLLFGSQAAEAGMVGDVHDEVALHLPGEGLPGQGLTKDWNHSRGLWLGDLVAVPRQFASSKTLSKIRAFLRRLEGVRELGPNIEG